MPTDDLREQVRGQGEQIRVQGEMLARLTAIVEQDHEDLHELRDSTKIIAEAEARREARDEVRAKVLMIGLPFATTAVGALIGHLIH